MCPCFFCFLSVTVTLCHLSLHSLQIWSILQTWLMYNYDLMLTAKPAIMSFTESSQQWMCSFCLCKVGHDREEYNIYVRGSGWEVWVRQEAHRKLVMKKARQTKGKKEKKLSSRPSAEARSVCQHPSVLLRLRKLDFCLKMPLAFIQPNTLK